MKKLLKSQTPGAWNINPVKIPSTSHKTAQFPPPPPAIPRQFRAEMAAEKEARQAETAEAQDAAKDRDATEKAASMNDKTHTGFTMWFRINIYGDGSKLKTWDHRS